MRQNFSRSFALFLCEIWSAFHPTSIASNRPRPRRFSLFCFRMNLAIHFSLIAAAVTYVMWKNVGNDKMAALGSVRNKLKSKKDLDDENKAC